MSASSTQEVDLVNLIEDRHHGLLDDFVFQPRCPTGAAAPWPSICRLALKVVPGTFHGEPVVEVDKTILQPRVILLPRYAIDSRRSLTLEGVETERRCRFPRPHNFYHRAPGSFRPVIKRMDSESNNLEVTAWRTFRDSGRAAEPRLQKPRNIVDAT
jgi:hypothetical protein